MTKFELTYNEAVMVLSALKAAQQAGVSGSPTTRTIYQVIANIERYQQEQA